MLTLKGERFKYQAAIYGTLCNTNNTGEGGWGEHELYISYVKLINVKLKNPFGVIRLE